MRALAVLGFLLVAAMQVVFAITGGDRPFPYREVQWLSVAGTLLLVWGASTRAAGAGHARVLLAAGAGVDLLTRVLQPILGLTRLSPWLNALLVAGWAWMLVDALRGRAPRTGLWILAAAHFLAALTATGRLTAFFALLLGAIGLSLAAPHVALSASRDTREDRSATGSR